MIQFSLNYKVKFTLDWNSKQNNVPICNVVNTNNTGSVSITHSPEVNHYCSLTVLDPINLQFDALSTSSNTSTEVVSDVTVFEGSLNDNNSELGPTGYYECNETVRGVYCNEHDQQNSKPFSIGSQNKKYLSIDSDYSVVSIKSRNNNTVTLDMSFSP